MPVSGWPQPAICNSDRIRSTCEVGLYPLVAGSSRDWGGIGMWAWFLSQLGKVLRSEGLGSRQIAFGHSRLGKAALWAAVQDPGLSGVVSIQSGCMGAAQGATDGAETPEMILRSFPHWFSGAFAQTVASGALQQLPQHRLLAAIPPGTSTSPVPMRTSTRTPQGRGLRLTTCGHGIRRHTSATTRARGATK